MRATLLVAACLVTAALAGCATSPGAATEAFTLSRQIRVHFDSENVASQSENPYDYVESAFVVRVNGEAIAPATATLVYQDRTGATVSRPLSDFTTLPTLAKGTEVRIGDANLTSGASLLVAGVEVVSRDRPHTDWWNVGGYPIGVRMDPGSVLSYRTTGSASESFALKDIRGAAPDTDDFVLDLASLSFAMAYDGTLDLSLASAPSSVVAEREHSAFPLDWKTSGKLTVPITVEASGRNTTSGQAFTAGFDVAPTSGVHLDANGRLWWNLSGSPVRADLSGGSWRSRVDATAWLTGLPEIDGGAFSCAGKAKADKCEPTEIPSSYREGNGTFEADTVSLDGFPWDVDPEVVANLTRLLDEDLVPGDELRFDVDIDSAKLPDWEADDGPSSFHVTGGAVLKAVGFESVKVAAGTFDALKLVERVDVRLELGAIQEEGETVLRPLTVEQRFVDTTMWLQRDTFVPLRIEQSMPIDLDQMVDAVLDNLGPGAWDDSPVAPLTGKNVDATVEGKSSIELTRHVPGARFSPYAVIGGFHSVGLLPALTYLGALGGAGTSEAIPLTPYPGMDDMYVSDDASSYRYADEPRELLFALESAGPIVGGVSKDYTVAARGEASYGELLFLLDDEHLSYGDGEPGTWCLVDAATDECLGFMDGYAASVATGDVLRFAQVGIAGSSLVVHDGQTGDILVDVVVR